MLALDVNEERDSDDTDNWEMAVRFQTGTPAIPYESDDDSDHYSYSRKRSAHGDTHSERRATRLCLDDALIMVCLTQSIHC